jgi:hypothetical protein
MSRRDLESVEQNIDAELAMAQESVPIDMPLSFATFDPTDPLASDPTDVQRYEVGLTGLHEAVVTMELLDEDLGSG